jgi:hypothetical protein
VRRSLALKGEPPLTAARTVAAAADGTIWIQAWDRLVEVDLSGTASTLLRGAGNAFAGGARPEAKGRGVLANGEGVGRLDQGKPSGETVPLPGHRLVALDVGGKGAAWVVGASDTEENGPHALFRADAKAAFRPTTGLPSASWCDVSATSDGGAWMAGGLSPGPSGEGILFHARESGGSPATARYRARATLLAVAAVGPDEAWAVGAAGTAIHVRGAEVTRYSLPSGEWLRAVLVAGPEDVWIGGDGGTLLHLHEGAFHPVAHPLGPNATITGLALAAGAVWAVGPSGILQIARR